MAAKSLRIANRRRDPTNSYSPRDHTYGNIVDSNRGPSRYRAGIRVGGDADVQIKIHTNRCHSIFPHWDFLGGRARKLGLVFGLSYANAHMVGIASDVQFFG